ncbi:MAG: methyltransferase domain-containing protein, partial [Acidimicrobiaceae bacterium]|nr:methyltransferase domain-containing protein [Acidimicrobiaceae bacterium]
SIVDFAFDSRLSDQFAVICAFQTLEHMDGVHEVFAAIKRLCRLDGSIYLSVPNDAAIEMQERFAKHWDMPPNHIGRWNYRAFQEVAGRHGLRIAEYEVAPYVKRQALLGLCWAAIAARAYDDKTLAGFVNSIAFRPIRGLGKYALALTQLPSMLGAIPSLCGGTQWVHIRPVSGAP